MNQPVLPLTDQIKIPQMGFGTYGLGPNATAAILHALQTGYRHIDTADIYGSHENIAEALNKSGLSRNEVFITTKLWSHSVSAKRVGPAVDRFLSELRTEYIDLLLIHWPSNTAVAETLTAMDDARKAGKVRALGVSNFDVDLLEECKAIGISITNDQIEFNLNHKPEGILDYCKSQGLTVTAYSPLERGSAAQEQIVADLAKVHSVAREKILLSWLMGKGMIVIPRSANARHIVSNFQGLQIKLSDTEIYSVDNVD